ncbi:hypothetical protein CSUB01_12119 [Colletotrichum sublineola]|uniref:Uncharacterized protein n=1 Tax=Colletotrichum sublineola TaxID=1173701 RepID=A0A066Y157_COLSU|nr:hypothetical protein CSUB01_12119 [Colletotrichum sublineola]
MCLNNSYQTVCGISVDWYREAGPRAGVAWCVRVRAEILWAIVTSQCLPPCVNHPEFKGRFIPNLRVSCNMVHGDDFASVIGPQFDRLVTHFAKRWVITNGIVLEDSANGFRFNQELVERCFGNIDSIERWLRDDMGKLDWWEKVARDPALIARPPPPPPPPPTPYPSSAVASPSNHPKPATPKTPVTQTRRRVSTATSTAAAGKCRRLPQTPPPQHHHKGRPGSAEIDGLVSSFETLGSPSNPGLRQSPLTPTRCPPGPPLGPPLGLFSDPASGLARENQGQMPAAVSVSVSPVPAQDATPVLGPELWGSPPTPRAVVPNLKPSRFIFPPTPAPSLASAKAPSNVVPPSPEQFVFPSSLSSFPAPSTTSSSYQTCSVAGTAPSTFVSSVAPPSFIPSSMPRRSHAGPRPPPPPPPTTILTDRATDTPLVAEVPAVEHHTHDDHGDSDGCNDGRYDADGRNGNIGAEKGVDNLERRIRESLEATRLAWRNVVEAEAAAQFLMFGMDGTM